MLGKVKMLEICKVKKIKASHNFNKKKNRMIQ